MHAIIRLGNGKYYTSAVFGYYDNITATDDYERYLESIYSKYYIVLNKEKTTLMKQYVFDRKNRHLSPNILIIDDNHDDNWHLNEAGFGGVDFLPKNDVLKMIENKNISDEVLSKCLYIDSVFQYDKYIDIKNENDIENLMAVSGCFHDARIAKLEESENDSLYVLFDGVWGCSIEIWFEGDVSYNTNSRNPEVCDPYWYGSSVIFQNGYVYFCDEEDMSVDEISNEYCWFKARKMKYHVIPD